VYLFGRFDRAYSKSVILEGRSLPTGQTRGSGKSLGVDFQFDNNGRPIGLRIGISHVSIENARQNLETETCGLSFEALVENGKGKWEEKFALIEPEFDNRKSKTIFYTALYRSFQMPTLFQDVNGDYFGFDKKVHKAEGYKILDHKYDVNAEGVDGNDDGATLSSWYLFASLGLYPIAGSVYYELGAPIFKNAAIHLGDKILEIKTENFSANNRYVSKIWLNGKLLNGFRLSHSEIVNGGVLKYEMSYLPVRYVNKK
jgi:putative alpha-1,2-mannosidase